METNKTPINISISTSTILKVFLVLIIIYILVLIKDVLVILFVSLILASSLDPWVTWMQKRKIPRGIGVMIIYSVLFLIITISLFLIIPPMINQMQDLSQNFPRYFEKIISGFNIARDYVNEHGILKQIKDSLGSVSSGFQGAAGGIFSTVTDVFGGILSFFLILVITFYMIVEENAMRKIVWSIAPEKHQPYIMQLISKMQKKVGLWLQGQIILSIIIFALTYVGLLSFSFFGAPMEYALVLAIIAGLTEFVPYLGPTLASVPAIFLAFTKSPMLAVCVIILYYIIQMVENHIIVPKLMQKVVGLNPVIIIVVLLIGFKVAGILGAVLAIPVATAASVFVKDFFDKRYQA